MNKGSVPTAIAAIVVIVIFFVGYMYIRDNYEQTKANNNSNEASQIGELPKIRVIVSGKVYTARLESNKTAKSFLENLPLSMRMKTNDAYSKIGYTYVKFSPSASKIKKVQAGDIVLMGESEVILFFKDCNPNEKYSRIGHVDNLDFIEADQVTVGFSKID